MNFMILKILYMKYPEFIVLHKEEDTRNHIEDKILLNLIFVILQNQFHFSLLNDLKYTKYY